MRILLDECVDRRLATEISGHDVKTVPQMGWAGIKNGELLTLAEKQFEVFVTVDRNLSFQQNLARYNIAVVILRARTNRLRDLRPLAPELLKSLLSANHGEVLWIGSSRNCHATWAIQTSLAGARAKQPPGAGHREPGGFLA